MVGLPRVSRCNRTMDRVGYLRMLNRVKNKEVEAKLDIDTEIG